MLMRYQISIFCDETLSLSGEGIDPPPHQMPQPSGLTNPEKLHYTQKLINYANKQNHKLCK